MPFNVKKFMSTEFATRTQAVRVDGLKDFFGENEEPLWTVRGMTYNELSSSREAAEKNKQRDIVAVALAVRDIQIEQMREKIGVMPEGTTLDTMTRIEQLVMCSVDPVCDHALATHLAINRMAEFSILTSQIQLLSAMGADIKKSAGSGKTRASEMQ